MKKILMLTMLSMIVVTANSQSIAPAESGQYCPLQDITFTVRLPLRELGTPITINTDASFVPGGGVTTIPYNIFDSSNAITKFNFAGKFGDNNTKQTFTVVYTKKGSTQPSNQDFVFRYIKSLKNAAPFPSIANSPCKVLNLGIGSVTVPRCVIQNIPLNFNNVPYSTPTEPSDFCWGKITQYEYQLPNEWSIGNSMSNGSNWIIDDSNVVITSNLGNGDLGKIRVRPSNANCGTGLQNGQLIREISISRPAPTLSIIGTDNTICSGCKTFQLNGMPSGAAVQWSIVGSGATLSGCSTCPTVSVCRNSSANTSISLKATVTHCSFTYTKEYPIVLGNPPIPSIQYVTYYGIDVGLGALLIPDAVYNWYEGGVLTEAGGSSSYVTTVACGSTKFVQVEAVNACGVSSKAGKGLTGQCGGTLKMLVSPNPADDNISIALLESEIQPKGNSPKSIFEITILDKMGNVKLTNKYNGVFCPVNFYIGMLKPDIYLIKVFDGKQWHTQQFLVK